MTHRRDIIESDTIKLLKKHTSAKENVFSFEESLYQDNLPIKVTVFSPEENVSIYSKAPRAYKRTLDLNVSVFFRGEKSYLQKNNALSKEIEKTMLSNELASDFDREINLVKTTKKVDDSGEELRAALNLSYEIQYITEEDPPPISTDFSGVSTEI